MANLSQEEWVEQLNDDDNAFILGQCEKIYSNLSWKYKNCNWSKWLNDIAINQY